MHTFSKTDTGIFQWNITQEGATAASWSMSLLFFKLEKLKKKSSWNLFFFTNNYTLSKFKCCLLNFLRAMLFPKIIIQC